MRSPLKSAYFTWDGFHAVPSEYRDVCAKGGNPMKKAIQLVAVMLAVVMVLAGCVGNGADS